MDDRKDIKKLARKSLKGMYFRSVLVGFIGIFVFAVVNSLPIFSYISFALSCLKFLGFVNDYTNNEGIISELTPAIDGVIEWCTEFISDNSEQLQAILFSISVTIACIILLYFAYRIFLAAIIRAGIFKYFTEYVRNNVKDFSLIKLPFTYYKRVILTSLIAGAFILLGWLLIVPGVIFQLMFYFRYHILNDNPNHTPLEILKLSAKLMKGHKREVLMFELSFVGWKILSSITKNLVGILYSSPYYLLSKAHLYEQIKQDFANTRYKF